MKTRSFPLSDEVGPPASLTAIPAGSDEAGPDASCARSAIAPLRSQQISDKYQLGKLSNRRCECPLLRQVSSAVDRCASFISAPTAASANHWAKMMRISKWANSSTTVDIEKRLQK